MIIGGLGGSLDKQFQVAIRSGFRFLAFGHQETAGRLAFGQVAAHRPDLVVHQPLGDSLVCKQLHDFVFFELSGFAFRGDGQAAFQAVFDDFKDEGVTLVVFFQQDGIRSCLLLLGLFLAHAPLFSKSLVSWEYVY